jgi:hypothetical protein
MAFATAQESKGHQLQNTAYDLRWAYDRLNGNVAAPFGISTAQPVANKNYPASPVMWQPYTIIPRNQPTKYQGGIDCTASYHCTITTNQQTVAWDQNNSIYFTGQPTKIETKFNLDDAKSALGLEHKFEAFLATEDQSVPLWPKHFGFDGKFTTYHLNAVWGISPQSHYFAWLRYAYSQDKAMTNNDVTFKFHIEAQDDEDWQAAFVKQSGQVLKNSKFMLNVGDGPYVDEGKNLFYFQGDQTTDSYWTLAAGKINIASKTRVVPIGDFDDWGWGKVCFSNYWHNSVFAVRDAGQFKKVWGKVACPLGYYASCHKAVIDMTKIPPLSITLIDTGDLPYEQTKTQKGYTITVQPEDYILTTKNAKGEHIFQELLIGDLNRAVNNSACPPDSKFGIGNLFYMHHNVNFVQSQVGDDHTDFTFKIGIQDMVEVDIKGTPIQNAVVWLGILSVALFYIAIMVCKSFSKPLEEVDLSGAPHATIGNDGDDGEYAKADDSA